MHVYFFSPVSGFGKRPLRRRCRISVTSSGLSNLESGPSMQGTAHVMRPTEGESGCAPGGLHVLDPQILHLGPFPSLEDNMVVVKQSLRARTCRKASRFWMIHKEARLSSYHARIHFLPAHFPNLNPNNSQKVSNETFYKPRRVCA